MLDARVLLATLVKVLRRHGVAVPGEVTMLSFIGDPAPSGDESGGNGVAPAGPQKLSRVPAQQRVTRAG